MEAALYDPAEGYYQRSDLKRWGRDADYRTSAERSELFSATFARYFARSYEELGRPKTWTIVEAGAGEASFALRILRALREEHLPVFEATRYCLEEVSGDSLSRAREQLVEFADRVAYESREVLEEGIYFSNELLDAFPVHRVTNKGELYVTLDDSGNFVWATGQLSAPRLADYSATLE